MEKRNDKGLNCEHTIAEIACICTSKTVITIAIRLRYNYDTTTPYRARLLPFDAIRREQKMNMSIFRRSHVVVVS